MSICHVRTYIHPWPLDNIITILPILHFLLFQHYSLVLFFSIKISLITLPVSETCLGPQPTFYPCSMLLISYHAISMICTCITYYFHHF